jgi:YkoY family integral membrane protein
MGVFDFITDYHYEPSDILVFLTLLLLEGVLSFDNAAILAAMVRKLPVEQRRKALLYGLGGAYVFRFAAILFVAFIIEYQWLKIVGGLYLVYLAGKHLLDRSPHDLHELPGVAKKNFLGLSPFWSVVVAVELADIAFALDQVLVAVGLFAERTQTGSKVLLIVIASFIAILFLRISAYYVGRLMDWFPKLETLAYIAVGWVGLKLIVSTGAHYVGLADQAWVHFIEMKEVSVAVTFSVIVLPVAVKAFRDFVLKRRDPNTVSREP